MMKSDTMDGDKLQDLSNDLWKMELKLLALCFLLQNQSSAFTPGEEVYHGLGFILEDMGKKAAEIKIGFGNLCPPESEERV